jgi:hypothetical protein
LELRKTQLLFCLALRVDPLTRLANQRENYWQ